MRSRDALFRGPSLQINTTSIRRKIRSHAETPCAQVSSSSIRLFKGYRRKIGPGEAETDSRCPQKGYDQPAICGWERPEKGPLHISQFKVKFKVMVI